MTKTELEASPAGSKLARSPAATKRALVVLNPVSGQRDPGERREAIERALRARGFEPEIRETTGDGDCEGWSRAGGRDGFDLVVASGGDGTLAEAASGLATAPKRIPLLIVPAGTANVVAQALGIPQEIEDAVALLDEGRALAFDVGHLPDLDRHFLLMVAVGLPAQMIRDTPRDLKNRFGFLAYVWSILKSLIRSRSSRLVLQHDAGELRFRGHTVLVINVGHVDGLGLEVTSNVSPHDGRLDVAIGKGRSLWDVLLALWEILRGRRSGDRVAIHRTRRIRIESRSPLPVQADGDLVGTTPVEVELVEDGVEIFVPRGYEGDSPEPSSRPTPRS